MNFNVGKFVGGIGVLIAIYLFLSQGNSTVNIINTFAGNSIAGIKTLQGR